MQLAIDVYTLTKDFPKQEIYGLTSQMRRSAISVPSNIAEGQGRLNKKEFEQFLGIARGSTYELQTQLDLARALKMAPVDLLENASCLSQEVGRMIFSLIESLHSSGRHTERKTDN
jgi:four helix bundle protein